LTEATDPKNTANDRYFAPRWTYQYGGRTESGTQTPAIDVFAVSKHADCRVIGIASHTVIVCPRGVVVVKQGVCTTYFR